MIANDSRTAALATYLFHREDRPRNLVAIKVGQGIGAGLVLDGELFSGDGDGAGEIGHRRRARRGAVPLRTLRLPGDGRQRAGDPQRGRRGRRPRGRGLSRARRRRRPAATSGRSPSSALPAARSARPIANLTGTLDVREIVVLGSVTASASRG